ncbi:DUF6443 domain-containing protein [Muricauda sp. SCSIO 64092]|uniref:DUF6443 domain-containing protein n=1 Tax=Allomuricauda sp. SCSIO 64092 TaxID=2908842 RepID=UPI001FF212D2|nr:DUF6443 domain-containing protein [Muricauda sp. SCSIO 64092]UOY08518.1 DUF6443 domain-containing protein [Muricauda sp. SCSIO 64092]
MKKYRHHTIILVFHILCLSGFGQPTCLSVPQNFGHAGGNRTVFISDPSCKALSAFSNVPGWLTVIRQSGNIQITCQANTGGERNASITYQSSSGMQFLWVNQNAYPATPPMPSITQNCGNTVLTRGNPTSGVTWYWQASSGGTSISNSSSSITRTSGSVYYLRPRNSAGEWGTSRTVGYSINTVPGQPSAPSVANNCGGSVLTRGNPPSGITWYWQIGSLGTSTSNSSSSVLRSSGTTYYLRARNNSSGCWGPARTVSYSIKSVPPRPSMPSVANNCGSSVLTRGTPPSGSTWYWQSSSLGTSTSNSNVSVTRSSGTIYYLRARDNGTGCWSTARPVSYSIKALPPQPSAPSVANNCGNTVLTRGAPPGGTTWYWQSNSLGTSTSNSNVSVTRSSGTVYYLRARNNSTGCWGTARTVSYSINTVPAQPSAPSVANNCGNTVLTRGTPPSGITWYWQGSASGTSTSNSNVSVTRSSGTVYYLRARNNGSGCWGTARTVSYSINAVPAQPSAPSVVNNCGSTVLTRGTPSSGTTWYWQDSASGTSTSNSNVSVTRSSGTVYYLKARNNSTGCWGTARTVGYTVNQATVWYADTDGDGFGDPLVSTIDCTPPDHVANSSDQCPDFPGTANGCGYMAPTMANANYIHVRTYHRATAVGTDPVNNNDVIERLTYYDGLGRPMQDMGLKATPKGKDVVTHMEYDDYGRVEREYLPCPATGTVGQLHSTAKSDTHSYYKTNYGEDFPTLSIPNINAYAQKEFENSPLNRVLKQAAPGQDWKLGNGHEIGFGYHVNSQSNDGVPKFEVVFAGGNPEAPTLHKLSGAYATGELYKNVTYDENHTSGTDHSTEEFVDKNGRVILKRTYNNGPHDTYYVYDDYGNLTYVIPPKVDASDGVDPTELNELCYQYRYDYRNRLVEKKLPGKGTASTWEEIVYNKLDQPIMTRDPNLRVQQKWLFTKYDVHGRVAYTGMVSSTSNRASLQTAANNATAQYESRQTSSPTLADEKVLYSNSAYPNTLAMEIHTVNYYDSYADTDGLSVPTTVLGQTKASNVKGLATVSKVRVLDPSATAGQADWITTITGYDVKGRPIYTASKNGYLNTTDIVETQLDFGGKVVRTRTSHTRGTNAALVTTDNFSYDHRGRLVKQEQTIGSHTETIVENYYDDLGRLAQKKVGGGSTGSPTALQEVDYRYNVRGWLKSINNGTAAGGDLWGMEIAYNDPTNFGGNENPKALFNGNISQVQWKTASPNNTGNLVSERYSFGYDALNRLTSARDNTIRYNMTALYDKNGNITELNRNGPTNPEATTFGAMDRLGYSYDAGNKLTKVLDIGNKTYGFKDGNTDGHDYWYDANGNMVRDLNKGIGTASVDGINYNHLNLPTSVVINNAQHNGTISYIYDATGVKLKKTVGSTTTEYAGNYIYENNALQFFGHPEGYVMPNTSSGYDHVYQHKDHLGNVRLAYTEDPSNPGIPTIIEENNYYPFGLEHKGYNNQINGVENNYMTYLGQEINKELGLNWLTFRYRNYMPEIGRFFGVDPISEEFFSISTYQFAHNNPIWKIELEGLEGQELFGLDFINIEPIKFKQSARTGNTIHVSKTTLTSNGEVSTAADNQNITTLTLGSNVKQEHVTDHSAVVISDNLESSGNNSATITSGFRDPKNQARVMFNNIKNKGVENQKSLYGAAGDQVIDVYSDGQDLNNALQELNDMFGGENSTALQLSSDDIKSAMTDKINEVGPGKVSKHSSDPNTLNVIDISPGSVANGKQFGKSLKADNRINKVITPPKDPAFHIEIPQN